MYVILRPLLPGVTSGINPPYILTPFCRLQRPSMLPCLLTDLHIKAREQHSKKYGHDFLSRLPIAAPVGYDFTAISRQSVIFTSRKSVIPKLPH